MPDKLKVLSGKQILKILEIFGFKIVGQKGSHVKLSRKSLLGEQALTIPNHRELDKGILKAIYNQCLRYIKEDELIAYFYTDK